MASEVLLTISRDEVERARLISEEKFQLDLQSKMVYAERKGREEGREESQIEFARNALKMGFSIDAVHKITGLDMDTIEGLL